MEELNNNEIQALLEKLNQDLSAFPDGMNSLETELESSAKHLPAYLKIVKTHIDQLAKVLNMENHNHRTLESAGLAEPVQQLIRLFRELKDDDLLTLEELAIAAKDWQADFSKLDVDDSIEQLQPANTAS